MIYRLIIFLINNFRLNHFNSIFSFHFRIKIAFNRITFWKIKINVILYVKYMFKKVKKIRTSQTHMWVSCKQWPMYFAAYMRASQLNTYNINYNIGSKMSKVLMFIEYLNFRLSYKYVNLWLFDYFTMFFKTQILTLITLSFLKDSNKR